MMCQIRSEKFKVNFQTFCSIDRILEFEFQEKEKEKDKKFSLKKIQNLGILKKFKKSESEEKVEELVALPKIYNDKFIAKIKTHKGFEILKRELTTNYLKDMLALLHFEGVFDREEKVFELTYTLKDLFFAQQEINVFNYKLGNDFVESVMHYLKNFLFEYKFKKGGFQQKLTFNVPENIQSELEVAVSSNESGNKSGNTENQAPVVNPKIEDILDETETERKEDVTNDLIKSNVQVQNSELVGTSLNSQLEQYLESNQLLFGESKSTESFYGVWISLDQKDKELFSEQFYSEHTKDRISYGSIFGFVFDGLKEETEDQVKNNIHRRKLTKKNFSKSQRSVKDLKKTYSKKIKSSWNRNSSDDFNFVI